MNIDTKSLSSALPLIIGIAIIFVFTAAMAWWILTPSWVPLFGLNGTQDSRSEAVKKLMEWSIPYKEDESTGFVLVMESHALEIRNRLNALGVLNAGGVGFELFSENDYGMSEFTQRINYQRALEGELSRTIRSFADVRQARVHLSVPKESIFKDKQMDTKASVVIQTRPGQVISEEQVYGIGKLIAGSVPNLKSDNVIVIDDQGKVLSSSGQDQNNQKQYTSRSLELTYTQKARELVEGIARTSDIQIAVNTRVNFDKVKSIKDQIIPGEEGSSGYLSKIRRQSNINKDISKREPEGSQPQDILLEEEYLFTRERSEIEYASGQIESVSVGIVVAKELSQSMITNIEKVVASGLGLNMDRGDRITVIAIPPAPVPGFNIENENKADFEQKAYAQSALDKIKSLPTYVHAAGLTIVLLLILLAVLLARKTGSKTVIQLSRDEREQLLRDVRTWIQAESNERSIL